MKLTLLVWEMAWVEHAMCRIRVGGYSGSLGDGVGEGVLTYVTSASLPPARIVRGLGRGDGAKEAVSGADRRRRQEATEVQQCRASTGDPNIAARTRANIVL